MAGTDKIENILKERGSIYGPFSGHARLSRGLLEQIKGHKPRPGDGTFQERLATAVTTGRLSATDAAVIEEALSLICHKLARIANGNQFLYADNWDDIAGYAKLVPEFTKREDDNDTDH